MSETRLGPQAGECARREYRTHSYAFPLDRPDCLRPGKDQDTSPHASVPDQLGAAKGCTPPASLALTTKVCRQGASPAPPPANDAHVSLSCEGTYHPYGLTICVSVALEPLLAASPPCAAA